MNKDFVAQLNELDASYRFRIFAPSFYEDERTGKLRQSNNGRIVCDIFDRTTGQQYASAEDLTEPEALKKAIATARLTEKPLTPAQKLDKEARQKLVDDANAKLAEKNAELAAKNAEIAQLKAQLTEKSERAPRRATQAPPPSGD